MPNATILEKLKTLPDSPGVYLFKNSAGKVIYIGKARSLRHRVRSYFQSGPQDRPKIERLITQAADLELIATNSDVESLILEANLVREYAPRYNTHLKDDKHFPYIKVTTNEPFPRIVIVRRLASDGGTYFGPYTSARQMRHSVTFLSRLFRIRTCKLVIPHPKGKKYKVCLDYQMKRCGGPCEDFQTQDEYAELVRHVILALSGKSRQLIDQFTARMQQASADLRYEDARQFRDQIEALQATVVRQHVDVGELVDRDVLGLAREGTEAVAVVMQVREGALLGRQEFAVAADLEASDEEILESVAVQYYAHQPNMPGEIHLPLSLPGGELFTAWLRESCPTGPKVMTPQIGDKVRLVELANRNARLLLDQALIQKKTRQEHVSKMVSSLQQALKLKQSPVKMVCFDISNTGETDAVGSCVYFENGRPLKKGYRRFRIKGVSGQDDFTMMREVVGRYFHRLREAPQLRPDLVVVDGGKGQLSSAAAELASLGIADQPIISLAKRLEEIYLPSLPEPITIPKNSPALMLLKRIRDEAHRFAVTYNRKVRTRRTITSQLDTIKGIGQSRRELLLKTFGSVEGVRRASETELVAVKGISVTLARQIHAQLRAVRP